MTSMIFTQIIQNFNIIHKQNKTNSLIYFAFRTTKHGETPCFPGQKVKAGTTITMPLRPPADMVCALSFPTCSKVGKLQSV